MGSAIASTSLAVVPPIGFKERIRATIDVETRSPWSGRVVWELLTPHEDMSESDLQLGLVAYFYVRLMNVVDEQRAAAVHAVIARFSRRIGVEHNGLLERVPALDAFRDVAPLLGPDTMKSLDPLRITVSLGIAHNGLSPGTAHVKKNSWRRPFEPMAAMVLVKDLAQRLDSERGRLAELLAMLAEDYERRGTMHVGLAEASVADPALTAIGVWKRG